GTIDRAKQHRAEAAPGPDGDDNGPGSEPPPHGRFRYIRRSWPEAPESKESGRPPRVDGDGFLRYRLGWEPILAVKVSILRGEQRG
ncbi:hypothetical protein THAOC_17858, partial [Thalassiosira oceanica]